MATYTIHFVNNTNLAGSFCVFQKNANSPEPDIFPLAWRVAATTPHSEVAISWNTDYNYFWAKTGKLNPGVIFNAGEALPADMDEHNSIELINRDGNYKFVHKRPEQGARFMTIFGDLVPLDNGSVGVGMSGAPAFAAQAKSRYTYSFAPSPEYWVTFGDFQQGLVLDPSGFKDSPQIAFPQGIRSMRVTFNPGNTWTVEPGQD